MVAYMDLLYNIIIGYICVYCSGWKPEWEWSDES